MKLVEQSHTILSMDDIKNIEVAGRTCYKSEDKIGCTIPEEIFSPDFCADAGLWDDINGGPCNCGPACEHHSSNKFARMLIKRGHEAMIEHAHATVKFVTNRGVTHELVRHRMASFGQESTRYVKYDGDMEFIKPVWFRSEYLQHDDYADNFGSPEDQFYSALEDSEHYYRVLLKLNWRPEQAREVLPNALKTEIVVTANFREWRHIFKLRAIGTTGKPHPQMQALMVPVLKEFAERCPAVFGDLWEMYLEKNVEKD